jgi:hypothetical protein
MQSFRTELENPLVEKDIVDLEEKIRAFQEGKIHEENSGVYVWLVAFMDNASQEYKWCALSFHLEK